MSIVVCGIDPSLTGTALVWGSEIDGYQHVRCSSPACGSDVRPRIKRLERLVSQIDARLREIQPGIIFIEGYAYGAKFNREALAEFGGLLRWHGIEYCDMIEVPPSNLQQFVTGKGRATKNMMGAHCVNRWKAMLPDDDSFDAFGLWMLGMVAVGQAPATNQTQRDVIAKVVGDRVIPKATTSPVLADSQPELLF